MKWRKPYSDSNKITDIVVNAISSELGREVEVKKKKVDMTGEDLDSLTLRLDTSRLNEDIVENVENSIRGDLSLDCEDTKIAEDTEFVIWEFYF